MTTYWLSPSGSNTSGTGTSGNPWKTIAFADSHLVAGDTVRLLAGTYTLNSTSADAVLTTASGTSLARITWIADTIGGVFLISTGTSSTLWRSRGSFVDHIGFDLTSGGTSLAYGLILEGSNVTAQKCFAHDIAQNACDASIGGAGIYAGTPTYANTHVDILGCKAAHIGPSGCYYTHGILHCVQFGNVYNNICYGNGGQGIQFHHNAGNINCANNLCFNNDHGGIFAGNTGLDGTAHITNTIVENNICYGNGGCNGGVADSNGSATNSYKNNCSFNNASGNLVIVAGTTSGNLQVDPLFVNYKLDGSGNYRLKTGSPCINAGITANAPTTDYDGLTRGATIDIGPYEFAPGGSRTIPLSAALSGAALKIRTIPLSAAIIGGATGGTRTIPLSAALSGATKKTRTVPLSAALSAPGIPGGGSGSLVVALPGVLGTDYTALVESLSYTDTIDDPASATFSVADSLATQLSERQQVSIVDSAAGNTLFSGFINKITDQALPGNLSVVMRAITCTGNTYRADKRLWTGPEFDGWMAGDAVCEMHRAVLAQEGVLASYALRHDTGTTFGQGALTNVVANAAGLSLALSGSDFTQSETTSADFNTGTLVSVIGSGGSLNLTSHHAIKYTGTAGANLDKNPLFAYRKIWAGSITLFTGDLIYVDQWISSASPEIKAGIDIQFSDGTLMSDAANFTNFQDQWVIPLAPSGDLSGYADDQWMQRACVVQSASNGKVAIAIYLSIQGQTGGDYTTYFKNIKITGPTGTVRLSAFSGSDSTMKANVPGGSTGYFNLAASVVTVYEHDGSRVSPARSITSVGVVKDSVISWIEQDGLQPAQGRGSTYPPQVAILASYDDGATWLPCANHAPLPGLPVGMNAAGRTITLWQQLAVGGCSPEVAPFLDACTFTVFTAAACTKTDYVDIDNTVALLGAGTLSNCTSYTDGVKTTGQYRSWNVTGTDGSVAYANQTLYGQSGAGNPAQGEAQNYFFLRTDSGLDVRSRFDFAGSIWADFIAEIDIHFISNSGGTEYGFVYRTTGWSNTNNTYAYAAELTSNNIILNRAANGGTPGFTRLQTVALSLNVGAWYRMKVVVNGSSHKVYLNDALYINWTDGTYTAAGYVGVRFWNSTGGRDSAHFNNFGIIAYDASLQSISSRTTAALPLALTAPVGSSVLNWQASVPSSSTLLVESTIDNGTTWNTCTNGGPIPLLVPGFVPGGASLKVRFTMTNQAINLPIALLGFSAFVTGQYSATGTFVAPALDLAPANVVGSSSLSWVAALVPGTTLSAATSLDGGATYTPAPSSGSPIGGLVAQGVMVADDFDNTITLSTYMPTFWGAGPAPTFVINAALSRMDVLTGTNGLLVWTALGTARNLSIEVISDQCAAGGFAWRYIDSNNLYYVIYCDGSAPSTPTTVTIRKRVAGVDSQIFATSALPDTFARGTPHVLKVTMFEDIITCLFDGDQAAQFSDTSLNAAGSVALYQNSAVTSHWYSLRAQQLGDDASGQNVTAKFTLGSSDPAQNPLLAEVVTSVRGPAIMTGALLTATQYAYKPIGGNIADAARTSGMYWSIDKDLVLSMKDRAYSPAPYPLWSGDPLLRGTNNPPQLVRSSPLYRNRQYVTGAIDLVSVPESMVGDGSKQSWPLSYPVDSITSLTLDGRGQTVGVQGVDTGKNFYYQPGNNTLSADSALFPEAGAMIAVSYVGRVPYTAMREDALQQAMLAGIDGTSGIVEASEDCGGLLAAQADSIAQARIDEYALLSLTWQYTTARGGLAPGHFQSVFVPEYGMTDVDVLITSIQTTPWLDSDGNLNYLYDVSTTSGPNLGVWMRIFAT